MDRTGGLGSTDIVELAGLSPYQGASPVRVYGRKIGLLPDEDGRSQEEKEWGKFMERHLLEWYAGQLKDRYYSTSCERIPSRKWPWIWATPDGYTRQQGPMAIPGMTVTVPAVYHEVEFIEAKNVGSFMAHHWRRDDDDGIPDHVRAQVQIGMYCAEVTRWTVVAAIGGLPPRIYRVDYDTELAERLVEIGRVAWEGIQARREPKMDGTSSAREYLRAKYPRVEVERVESTHEQEELAAKRRHWADLEKAAKNGKDLADNELLAGMGEAGALIGDGWKMTWRVGANGKRTQRFTTAKGEE